MKFKPIIKIISVIAGSIITLINVSDELTQAKDKVKEASNEMKNS